MREEIIRSLEELKTVLITKHNEGSFITIEPYLCKLANGKTIKREKILKNGHDGSAAIIYPVTEDGRIILAAEPRVFTTRTVDIGLPAGYIEDNETPLEAAKRELLEETGYTSDSFTHLGSFYQDQGCSAAYNHYFLAENCKKIGSQKLDASEFVKCLLVDNLELEELLQEGYITGLNSAYAIERTRNHVRRREI